MAAITEKHILNIRPGVTAPIVVHCSQGDVGLELYFFLYNGDEAFDPTGAVISAHGIREDATGWGPVPCSISGKKVTLTLPEEATVLAGTGMAELTVAVDDTVVGTTNFAIKVEEGTFPHGATYSDDLSVYQSILAYAQGMGAQIVIDVTEQVDQQTIAVAEMLEEQAALIEGRLADQDDAITALRAAVGSPLLAALVADMTDEDKIYVYTGTETGYTAGDWYYYDGSDWVSGGVYNAVAVNTDTTLSVAGAPADAQEVGDRLAALLQPYVEDSILIFEGGANNDSAEEEA